MEHAAGTAQSGHPDQPQTPEAAVLGVTVVVTEDRTNYLCQTRDNHRWHNLQSQAGAEHSVTRFHADSGVQLKAAIRGFTAYDHLTADEAIVIGHALLQAGLELKAAQAATQSPIAFAGEGHPCAA